jgi:hypothetical protein
VKDWLSTVTSRMLDIYTKSNLYKVLPTLYGDIGTFATGALFIEDDPEDIIRLFSIPIGSFWIATDHRGKPNVFFREFSMTVRQLVDRFGRSDDGSDEIDWSKFSQQIKDLWDTGMKEVWVDVCHCVKPNPKYNRRNPLAKFKKYVSVYYEKGSHGSGQAQAFAAGGNGPDEHRLLSESGYDYFPVLAPRWETTGEDAYGTDCPGMTSLGDIKALQLMQKRKSQAVEKMVNPPMTGPSNLRNTKTSILPGDLTVADSRGNGDGFRPAHEVNPRVQELLLDIQDHQQRIRRAFFEDLFLMLAQSDRRQVTAREIDERHEEKLLALGPVLEQLNQDLLDPLIDITYMIMERYGMIPPPPEELQGVHLKIEYISIMAQAQKLVGIGTIERFMSFAVSLAGVVPEVMDKVDLDQSLDVYADYTSLPAGIVRSDDKVAQIRDERAESIAKQAQAERLTALSGTAKQLSETKLGQGSALDSIADAASANALAEA